MKVNLRQKMALRLNASEMKKAGLKSDLLELPAGESDVHESIAAHWYVKAHLVKEEKKAAPPPPPPPSIADQAKALEKDGKKRNRGESDEDFVARIAEESKK